MFTFLPNQMHADGYLQYMSLWMFNISLNIKKMVFYIGLREATIADQSNYI